MEQHPTIEDVAEALGAFVRNDRANRASIFKGAFVADTKNGLSLELADGTKLEVVIERSQDG